MNQFTAVATDGVGRIGMAGVVVNVAIPTKFYVVDDNTVNKTFEYDANGSPVESYSLNTATRLRAARRARWLVTRPGSSMPIARCTSTTT